MTPMRRHVSQPARCRPYVVPLPRHESVTFDDSYISQNLFRKSIIADTVEEMTYQHRPDHECYFHNYCTIGGRSMYNKREDERQCPITYFITFFAEAFLPCRDVQTFCRRIGANPIYHYRHPRDYTETSPYHFTLLHGKYVKAVRDDNVLINRTRGTVIKFLRNITSIKSFLVGAYASSLFSEQLGLARCVAFYPKLMCAEFEYVGHNLDFAIRRNRLLSGSEDMEEEDYSKLIDVSSQISAICKRLKSIGVVPDSLKVFNFCITEEEGKVVLCCLDRFGHKIIVGKHEGVVESLIREINPKLYHLYIFHIFWGVRTEDITPIRCSLSKPLKTPIRAYLDGSRGQDFLNNIKMNHDV